MADTKTIGIVKVITDTDKSYEHFGEVQGGFDPKLLKEHIAKYGIKEVLEMLNYMNWQVRDAMYNSTIDHQSVCIDGNPHTYEPIESHTTGGSSFGRCTRCNQSAAICIAGGQGYKNNLPSTGVYMATETPKIVKEQDTFHH